MNKTFATPNEAEKAGIEFAQKWINHLSPTFKTMTHEEVEQRWIN
jgi:hypothetical protein